MRLLPIHTSGRLFCVSDRGPYTRCPIIILPTACYNSLLGGLTTDIVRVPIIRSWHIYIARPSYPVSGAPIDQRVIFTGIERKPNAYGREDAKSSRYNALHMKIHDCQNIVYIRGNNLFRFDSKAGAFAFAALSWHKKFFHNTCTLHLQVR